MRWWIEFRSTSTGASFWRGRAGSSFSRRRPSRRAGRLPESYAGLHGFQPAGTPGQCLGGSYHAWVALPTCQLVVEVNLEGGLDAAGKAERPGQVVRAVRVTQSGAEVVSDLSTISCPRSARPRRRRFHLRMVA